MRLLPALAMLAATGCLVEGDALERRSAPARGYAVDQIGAGARVAAHGDVALVQLSLAPVDPTLTADTDLVLDDGEQARVGDHVLVERGLWYEAELPVAELGPIELVRDGVAIATATLPPPHPFSLTLYNQARDGQDLVVAWTSSVPIAEDAPIYVQAGTRDNQCIQGISQQVYATDHTALPIALASDCSRATLAIAVFYAHGRCTATGFGACSGETEERADTSVTVTR
jgi:hypothetical protein